MRFPKAFFVLSLLASSCFAQTGEVSVTQLQNEIAAANSEFRIARDATKRFQYKRLLADLNLELASRLPNPESAARRALTLYYDLLKIRTQPEIESDLLYRSAYAAELSGEVSSGINSLTRLIDTYPRDPIIPEAYFRRAEMRFVYGNYTGAEEDYSLVLRRSGQVGDTFQLQSLYKRGWAHYKQGDHRRALVDELTVLKSLLGPQNIAADGSLNVSDLSGAKQVLAEDALHEMTLNFAALGRRLPPGSFTAQTDSRAFEFLFTHNLIDYYQEQGQFADAANIALDFAQNQPNHPQAGALTIQAIAALDAGGLDDRALEAKKRFVRLYGVQKANWNGQPAVEVPAARTALMAYLDYITQATHAAAQSNNQSLYYQDAVDWYDTYLTIFPQSPRVAEINYLRADVLFEAKRYREAIEGYEKVAYELPSSPRAADAAYASVYAWRELAKSEPSAQAEVKASTLRFAQTYPSHPQSSATLARLAEDLFASGQVQEANAVSDKVIALSSGATSAQTDNAYRIRAAAAMADNNYVAAEAAYRQLLSTAPTAELPALREDLASTIYKRGEALVAAGDDAAAVNEFLRLQNDVPEYGEPASSIRSVALYDAAAAAKRAGNSAQAAQILETFRTTYPQNERVPKVNTQLAALYLELGDDDKALREFNRVGSTANSDSATRREALLESAELYAKNGNYDQAVATYKNYYYENEPLEDQAIEVQQRLVELYSTTGDQAKANFWRQKLIETNPKVNTERSKTLAASAALSLADQAETKFLQASLFPPLSSSLKVKRARLQEALDAYGIAANYGVSDVTTASTYKIGELYYAFNRALIESPRPDNLAADESARYEILLEEQAAPFTDQAITLHQVNADRLADGVNNEWVQKSVQRLSELLPAQYAKTERLGDGIVPLQ